MSKKITREFGRIRFIPKKSPEGQSVVQQAGLGTKWNARGRDHLGWNLEDNFEENCKEQSCLSH